MSDLTKSSKISLVNAFARLPDARAELFKYSNLRQMFALNDVSLPKPSNGACKVGADLVLRIHNGVLLQCPDESQGITITPASHDVGNDWQGQFLGDIGASLWHVRITKSLSAPLRVEIDGDAGLLGAFGLQIIVEQNVEVQILEDCLPNCAHDSLVISRVEIFCEAGAIVWHGVAQCSPGQILARNHIRLVENSEYHGLVLQTAQMVARRDVQIDFDGMHAQARLGVVSLTPVGAHQDVTTAFMHNIAECKSEQNVRAVVSGKHIFQGKVRVAQGADATDARQYCKALLLDERAEHYAKPELEIYHDTVQCAHGATTAAVDDEQMHYMRARGIRPDVAQRLIVAGFLQEAIDDWAAPDLQSTFQQALQSAIGDGE